ncbi:MAG TPA: hypothetical protein VH373_03240 [Jatrophihabitantaceae bacterium]
MDDIEVAKARAEARLRAKMPAALREMDLESLVGCTVDEARRRVEAAGGVLTPTDELSTFEKSPRRVNVVTESNRVVKVLGIG